MEDKYHLTREENVFLAKKRWDESIYSGMRMENRNVTFPQTQTILEGINVSGVALDDIQAILNMRDGWKYLLSSLDADLDIRYLCALQERIAYREALSWGELRTGSVGISGVKYAPPVPNEETAERELIDQLSAEGSTTEIALDVFAWICRSQLFWDGNKRTALLAANKILIERGAGILLVSDDKMAEFSLLLSDYYETGDGKRLKSFLYRSCIRGIDGATTEDVRSASARSARSSSWLKQIRRERATTQKELARSIGVSTNAIANIEQGQRKGSDAVWTKIERYFDVR
ncbi:MAG: helix-turn-helix domain-containing protein [Actinomycetia bacterium]|nr:helix-turn-helix domain-containing protein [Actinomycetes bacterium]